MIDLLVQVGISNVCISVALACIAFAVHRTGRLSLVAHLLWVLVLVKLITPPLFILPVVPMPVETTSIAAVNEPLQPVAVGSQPVEATIADTDSSVTSIEGVFDASVLADIARPTLLGIGIGLAAARDVTVINFTEFPSGTVLDDEYADFGIEFTNEFYIIDDSTAFLNEWRLDGFSTTLVMEFDQPFNVIGVLFPGVLRYEFFLKGEFVGWTENISIGGSGWSQAF